MKRFVANSFVIFQADSRQRHGVLHNELEPVTSMMSKFLTVASVSPSHNFAHRLYSCTTLACFLRIHLPLSVVKLNPRSAFPIGILELNLIVSIGSKSVLGEFFSFRCCFVSRTGAMFTSL